MRALHGRMTLAAAALGALAFYALVLLGTALFQLDGDWYLVLGDDAMISMRYARNLAEGKGLYWNEGGSPAGYSNFLWTLWMALGHWLLGAGVGAAAFVVASAFALHLATGWGIYRVLAVAGVEPGRAALGATVFLVSLQPLHWSAFGFETAALTALATWGAWALLRGRSWVGAGLLAAGVLVRDDFLLVAGVVAVASEVGGEYGGRARRVALALLPAFMCLGLLCLWRAHYYGAALPNTYFLKATGWPLAARLASGWAYVWPLFPAVAVALALLAWTGRRSAGSRPVAWTFGALLVAEVAYAGWMGGDAFPGSRLAIAAWPAFGIAFGFWPGATSWRNAAAAAAVAVLFVISPASDSVRSIYRRTLGLAGQTWIAGQPSRGHGVPPRYAAADVGPWTPVEVANVASCRAARRDAARRGLRGPSMAVYYAGAPPYFCPEFVAIDLLGKSDAHVARLAVRPGRAGHNKWDFEYSLGQLRPDYVFSLLPSLGAVRDPAYAARPDGEFNWHHLVRSEAFLRNYAETPMDSTWPPVFRRTDQASPRTSTDILAGP